MAPSVKPPSEAEVRQRLLKIVVERTGYPPDMVDQNASLEADLGIDSIKRVEILGELMRSFPQQALADRMQSLMEELSSAPSLSAIVATVSGALGVGGAGSPARQSPAAPAVPQPSQPRASQQAPSHQEDLPRYVMTPVSVDPPPVGTLPKGTVLVTNDGQGIAAALILALRERNIPAELLDASDLDPAGDQDALKAALTGAGSLAGLVYLPPQKDDTNLAEVSFTAWRQRLRQETGGLFALIKLLTPLFDVPAGVKVRPRFLCATTLGGQFGLGERADDERVPASHGGICGVTKTLAVERPGLAVKVVDLDARESAEALAGYVISELLADDGEVEVGWRHSHRWVPRPVAASVKPEGVPCLDSDSVVLLTGGARGITAEIALELAAQFRPTLILVGRAEQPAEEGPATAGIVEEAALKSALLADRQRQGRAASLPEVEAAYRKLVAEREIRGTFTRLTDLGARWEYLSADVRDPADVARVMTQVRSRHGRLDAVLHGAGLIEDKLLADKKWESFERVFETKALSAFVLAQALPEFLKTLRFVAFFTSVAGAFSNRGQADYVAGNEVANKIALELSDEWGDTACRVVALNWGPWQKGMASDAVQAQFQARGIEPIAVPDGRRAIVSELASADHSPVIVLGRGPWGRHTTTPKALGTNHPLLVSASPQANGGGRRVERVMDVEIDHFLDDHRLDGRAVLPMTVALEMMTELAGADWPELVVTEVRNVAVLKGVVLTENKGSRQTVRMDARVIEGPSASGVTVQVELRKTATPELISYRSTVELRRNQAPPRRHEPGRVRKEFSISVDDAYRNYLFHGPRFAHIDRIDGATDTGILARIRPSEPASCIVGGSGDWLIDPVALDSGLQLVLLWARDLYGLTPLPNRFKRYLRYGPLRPRQGDSIRCELVARAEAEGRIVHADLTFFEGDGTVVGVLEGLECAASQELNRLAGGQVGRTGGDALARPMR